MPLQDQHDAVALLDAERLEIVRALVRQALDVAEAEPALVVVAVDMQHRELLRVAARDRVHEVEAEVEGIGILECNRGRRAVLVLYNVNVLPVNAVLRVLDALDRLRFRVGTDFSAVRAGQVEFLHRFTRGIEDNRVEHGVLPVHGDHAVRGIGIQINAVAGVQLRLMLADLHQQVSGNHDIQLLPIVRRELDILALCLLIIEGTHIQRLRDTVPESVGEIRILHAVRVRNFLPLAGARHREAVQCRAVAFDNVRRVHAERQRAAVNEAET